MSTVRLAMAAVRNALADVMRRGQVHLTVGPVQLTVYQQAPQPAPAPEPSELARRAGGGK